MKFGEEMWLKRAKADVLVFWINNFLKTKVKGD